MAVWAGCHVYGHRLGLGSVPEEEMPSWGHVARTAPFFLAPFGTLVALLAFTEMTPQYACVAAIAVAVALLLVDHRGQVDLRRFARRLADGCVDAARQIAMIAGVIVCASIVVGVLQMTGLGVKITSAMLALAGDRVWMALVLTALAGIVLGMEVPTTAAFVICISVAGTAMRLGIGLFVLPPAFIANPALLRPDEALLPALWAALKIGLGIALVSYAVIGPAPGLWLRRTAALAAGIAAIAAFRL